MSKKSSRLSVTQVKFREHGYAYTAYLVSGRSPDGRRVRKQFKTEQEAAAWASTEEIRHLNQNRDVHPVLTRLTHEQLLDAELAFSRLRGLGTLTDAVTVFLREDRSSCQTRSLGNAVETFLGIKAASGVRGRTMKQIRSVLRMFVASVGADTPVSEITTEQCEKFLIVRGKKAKTFNNYRADLHHFFVHASSAKNAWTTTNPTKQIEKRKADGRGMPTVLSRTAAQALMAGVESYEGGVMVPFFALALFAGIRTGTDGELWKFLHSEPNDIAKWLDLKNGVIHIQPHISKTGEYRQTKIQPNLKSWLTAYPVREWPTNFDRHVKLIRHTYKLPHDVLRHTFFSVHVSAFSSIEKAALQGGNTESVVRRYYLNLMDSADAQAIWAIAPSKTKNQPNAQADDKALDHEAA